LTKAGITLAKPLLRFCFFWVKPKEGADGFSRLGNVAKGYT
jgi:hypothetical protein